jgi:hypothetical protein
MPWWPALWEHNYFSMAWPLLRALLSNNFVRGAVSGLGVVNLFAGFADLAYFFGPSPSNAPASLEAPSPTAAFGEPGPAEGRNPRDVSLHDRPR